MEQNKDEVDLIELLGIVYKKVLNLKYLFITIIVAFILLGWIYYEQKEDSYQIQLLLNSYIDTDASIKILYDLNKAHLRNANILDNEVSFNAGRLNENDSIIALNIIMKDTSKLEKIKQEFVQIFSDIPFVKEQLNQRRKEIHSLIDIYEKGIQEEKKMKEEMLSSRNIKTFLLNSTETSYSIKKLGLETELEKMFSIKFISTQTYIFQKQKSFLKIILIFSLIGFVLALSIVLLKRDDSR